MQASEPDAVLYFPATHAIQVFSAPSVYPAAHESMLGPATVAPDVEEFMSGSSTKYTAAAHETTQTKVLHIYLL